MEQQKEKFKKTISDFRDELHNHILSLELLCNQYDEGHYFLAPLIAVVLRTLLFSKGGKNSSLIEKSRVEAMGFVSSIAEKYWPNSKVVLSPYMPMMKMHVKDGVGSYESINSGKNIIYSLLLPFDTWWHQIALDDRRGGCYSRRDIVLTIADKFGAHSDSEVEKNFVDLSFKNSLGFQYRTNGDLHDFKGNPTYESLRQTAQEVIASYYFMFQYQLVRILGTEFIESAIYKRGMGHGYQCYIRVESPASNTLVTDKLYEDSEDTNTEKIQVTRNEYQDSDGNILTLLQIVKNFPNESAIDVQRQELV